MLFFYNFYTFIKVEYQQNSDVINESQNPSCAGPETGVTENLGQFVRRDNLQICCGLS